MKRTATTKRLVPYITSRKGEYGVLDSELTLDVDTFGRTRLAYHNETPDDRGPRGELWGRCAQTLDASGRPTGKPQWRLVHPTRQREAMSQLRCQIGFCPAETSGGYLFLAGAAEPHRPGEPVRTAQPPVCLAHARPSVEQCKHLREKGHVAFLARETTVWGVVGTRYRFTQSGLEPLPGQDDEPLPYEHPQLGWFLASQLVRELRDYDVVNLDDLVPAA